MELKNVYQLKRSFEIRNYSFFILTHPWHLKHSVSHQVRFFFLNYDTEKELLA